MINLTLAKQRGLSDDEISCIVELHKDRSEWYHKIQWEASTDAEKRLCANILTEIEYCLQALWGFPLDRSYHKFWELRGCSCPKMDNWEKYGTGQYIINQTCILHGDMK